MFRGFPNGLISSPCPQTSSTAHNLGVIVQEDGSHQATYVPGSPFKLALEVRDDKASLLQAIDQGIQAYVIGLLGIFHVRSPSRLKTAMSLSSAADDNSILSRSRFIAPSTASDSS